MCDTTVNGLVSQSSRVLRDEHGPSGTIARFRFVEVRFGDSGNRRPNAARLLLAAATH